MGNGSKRALFSNILLILIASVILIGCGTSTDPDAGTGPGGDALPGGKPLRIMTTIFPEYDWVRELIKGTEENWELSILLDNGVDMHSFQPSAEDIMELSSSDVLIYVGGESDKWVKDALADSLNKDISAISLMDILGDGARAEELKEGMTGDADGENDEHVWLSLRNAGVFCSAIAEELIRLDPDHMDIYRGNLEAYTDRLDKLDGEYKDAVSKAPLKVLMFCDRFPFRYFTEDYGLEYFAAFSGCSAETEASFETIAFLSDKAKELGIETLLIIDGSDGKIAETVSQNTGIKDMKILTMDSIQSVKTSDIGDGISYLSIMESNLSVLKQALGLKPDTP
ncbi:MAG: metal ABC transporter substrate-binding protein [Lachnospiraceae bacterium]|nr:metal ABC transporter substrate-binding protein [Lachnospiraceae bacterium]